MYKKSENIRTLGLKCLAGTVAALLSLAAAVPATASPGGGSLPQQLASKVTTDGVFRHLLAFQRIADAHGGNRAAGSAGYQQSVDYVSGALTRAGFDVTTPEFNYVISSVKTATLTVDSVDYEIFASRDSTNTPLGGLSAPLSLASGTGCQASDYPSAVRGTAVLAKLGDCGYAQKQQLAGQAGAAALVIYNDLPESYSAAEPESAQNSSPLGIPTVAVYHRDGVNLLDKIGVTATIDVQIDRTEVSTRSVIAQTRTGRSDNVVMAGAHLDSVEAGPGINDDGSGSAALLETALQLGGSPTTENAVRFAWWGAEEKGLLGSTDYVSKLTFDQQLDIAMYMNFDMIASPNPGYFVMGDDPDPAAKDPLGSKSIAKVFADYLSSAKGISSEKLSLSAGRTDHVPFVQVGIPSGGVFTGIDDPMTEEQAKKWDGKANQAYDPNYHGAGDTLFNINRKALGINSAAIAWAVGTFALDSSAVNGIPPREQRAALRAKIG